MNEHLTERFGHATKGARVKPQRLEVLLLPPKLNSHIRGYYEKAAPSADSGALDGHSHHKGDAFHEESAHDAAAMGHYATDK